MDLDFLYRFGYDYASMHVHPMAEDGEDDFRRLTSKSYAQSRSDSTVVKNSILVQTLLVPEARNVSRMRWHAILYEFLDHMGAFLKTGDQQFNETFGKIGRPWPGFRLCEPQKPGGEA